MDAEARFAAIAAQPFDRRQGGTRLGGPGIVSSIRDLVAHRELLGLLVRRDVKSRYKDSALGIVWALARPLTQLAIYYVVIGHFLSAAKGIPDFAIYVFTGLTVYMLFSEIVASGTNSILGNAGLVKKVYVPREIFPLASVGSAIFNLGVQLLVLIAATVVLGAFPWDPELLMAIPSLLLLIVYGTAIALLLSAVTVYLRDIAYLVEVVLLVLMWASPILYSWQMVRDVLAGIFGPDSWALAVYTNNPVTLAVLGAQRAFWTAGHDAVAYPDHLLLRIGIALVIGLALLVVSHRVFRRLQGNFAQEL